MATFYFYDPTGDAEDVYSLSATTDIKLTCPAQITSSAVEDGSSLADNTFLDPVTATFTGVITSVGKVGAEGTLVPPAWLDAVRQLRRSKKPLTMVAHTEILQNCLIGNLDLSKTKAEGLSGWKVNISFKEVRLSERARMVYIKEPKTAVKDKTGDKKASSNTPTKQAYATSAAVTLADGTGVLTTDNIDIKGAPTRVGT